MRQHAADALPRTNDRALHPVEQQEEFRLIGQTAVVERTKDARGLQGLGATGGA